MQKEKDSKWEHLYGQLSSWLQYKCPQRTASRFCCGVLTLLSLWVRCSLPRVCGEGVSAHSSRCTAMQQLQYGQTKGQSLSRALRDRFALVDRSVEGPVTTWTQAC